MSRCRHGDPCCPCQDGDVCHYEGLNPMRRALLRICKLRQYWVVENLAARHVIYCASFEDAVEEMEVQMLEFLLVQA